MQRWRKAYPEKHLANASRTWYRHRDKYNKTTREKRQIEVYGRVVPIEEMTKDRFRAARALGYRSGLEVAIARQLEEAGVSFGYETLTIPFAVNEVRKYKADIVLPNGIVVELKGQFTTQDRKKHLLIRQQHPEVDLRLVFSSSRAKIGKASKTSYADWCSYKGFRFADRTIPVEWLREPPNKTSLAAIKRLTENT